MHRYQVLGGGLDLTVFDDGRGPAVYAGLGSTDLRGASILRLTAPPTEPEPVGGSIGPFQIMALHAFDADGAGPEPAQLHAGGWSFNQLWRLVDDEWRPLPGRLPPFGREIRDIADYDDGTGAALYVTGDFGTHFGLPYEPPHGLARWDEASQEWAAVGGGLWREAGTGDVGRVMAVFDEDGAGPKRPALFIGGAFDHAGELGVPGLVRWDGAAFSALGELVRDDGKTPTVSAMFVHDDGSGESLYIGGAFHEAGGVRSPGLVRWDGERFTDVGGGLPPSPSSTPSFARTLATWREGGRDLLMVGGHWTRTAPAPDAFRAPLVLWDGAQWRPLMTEGAEVGSQIRDALAIFEDGEQVVYIAGTFNEIEGRFIQGLARWNGERWSGYNRGLGRGVTDLHVFDDGAGPKLVLPHQSVIDEQFWDELAAWDGEQFVEYQIRGLEGETVRVHTVTEIGGRLRMYVASAGEPTRLGTGVSSLLWEYDGAGVTFVTELNRGLAKSSFRRHIFEYDDGSGPAMHIAADLFDVGGQTVHGDVVKREGDKWFALGEGLIFAQDTQSPSVIVFDNGAGPEIYVGGRQMTIGGEKTRGGLARWDGEKWHGTVGDYVLPGTTGGECWDMEIYQGKLHAILALVHPAGYILPGVARLDGETWTVLGLTDPERFGMIRDMHVYDDGYGEKLYVVGEFPELAGVKARGGIIWDGESWTPMSGGFDPLIAGRGPQAMAVYDAGDGEGPDLYIGGNYRTVTNVAGEVIPTGRLARWSGCRDSCPADLTGDGNLDFADFLAFQALFAAMDPRADFDGDEGFTFFDFLAFQDAFAAGCP